MLRLRLAGVEEMPDESFHNSRNSSTVSDSRNNCSCLRTAGTEEPSPNRNSKRTGAAAQPHLGGTPTTRPTAENKRNRPNSQAKANNLSRNRQSNQARANRLSHSKLSSQLRTNNSSNNNRPSRPPRTNNSSNNNRPSRTTQNKQQQQQQQAKQATQNKQQQQQQQAKQATQNKQQPAQHTQEQQRAQQAAWQGHQSQNWQSDHRTWQQRGGYHGYRIPDNRYNGYFGQGHGFVIFSQPYMVVGGFPRFQYSGYWFSLVDPWPSTWAANWYETDNVYVVYADNGYYMYNQSYPGVGIAISVSL